MIKKYTCGATFLNRGLPRDGGVKYVDVCMADEAEAEVLKLKVVIKAQAIMLSAYRTGKSLPDWALDCVRDYHEEEARETVGSEGKKLSEDPVGLRNASREEIQREIEERDGIE